MNSEGPPEERVVWRERFQAEYFDFRGKSTFIRFDGCEFVKCTLLIDNGTDQLAFTACVFKDCNVDKLEPDEERGLYFRDNFFDRPLAERRADFENRLAPSSGRAEGDGEMTDALSDGISALVDDSRSCLGGGGIYRPCISQKLR